MPRPSRAFRASRASRVTPPPPHLPSLPPQALQHELATTASDGAHVAEALSTTDLAGNPDALMLQGRTKTEVARKFVKDLREVRSL